MTAAPNRLVDELVTLTVDQHVATLTLDRPEKLNAISVAMDRRLNALVYEINVDDDIRVVVIVGEGGRSFCAGSDLGDLEGYGTSWQYRNRADRNLDYAIGILKIRKPVIAAIDGFCIGGGLEIACAADLRFATSTSTFAAGEIKWGWHGGSGATQLLTRLVGPGFATELLLTGQSVNAERADRIGLLNGLFGSREAMLNNVQMTASTIAGYSPIPVEAVKKLVRIAQSTALEVGMAYENDLFSYEMRTNDAAEGRRAFAEKRPPNFSGM